MDIRKMQVQDLTQVATLFDQYRVFYGQDSDVEAAYSFLKERFEKQESIVFVADQDDEILGFTQVYPIFSSVQMKPASLLNDLYVAASARKQGIGAKLIKAVFEDAEEKGSAYVTLETGTSNIQAQSLYQGMGMIREDSAYHFNKDF